MECQTLTLGNGGRNLHRKGEHIYTNCLNLVSEHLHCVIVPVNATLIHFDIPGKKWYIGKAQQMNVTKSKTAGCFFLNPAYKFASIDKLFGDWGFNSLFVRMLSKLNKEIDQSSNWHSQRVSQGGWACFGMLLWMLLLVESTVNFPKKRFIRQHSSSQWLLAMMSELDTAKLNSGMQGQMSYSGTYFLCSQVHFFLFG